MPIYEFFCKKCDFVFEKIYTQTEAKAWSGTIDAGAICPKCSQIALRCPSSFSFNQIGVLTGVDDTDALTLGKLVANKGVPSEFKPTIAEIQHREKMKQMNKEYLERVKKYDLDKPTRQEIAEAKGKSNKIEIVSK